ncbi:T9SS type B sorting domain-containing protein [Cyclobacterium xiamenense]|nr:T9SS type B sorting domain-containing protein [Cyclobacterium xiamenense]
MKRQFFAGLIFLFFMGTETLFSQVRIDFSERTSILSPSRSIYSINGDFSMIGNTNMTLSNYGEDLMNDGMMVFVDVDNDPETFNSSTATLQFSEENGANSACSRVLFAGLYWSGRGPSDVTFDVTKGIFRKPFDKRKVKFKGPGQQEYLELEAADNEIRYPASLNEDLGLFVGYKDVTEWVRAWGEGAYTVADIGLIEGTNYHYGGWGMVVVYENPVMKKRDVSVFDGYAFVRGQGAAFYDIDVSGFSATESGDVHVKLGVMAGEGDVGADGDYFAIERGETNDFERLSHGNNDVSNFFNSSIYTGGNPRNPNLKNNTGMDIAIIEIDNPNNGILGNNQTRTRFRYGSTWDVYVIYNITMAIDANDVEVETFHELISINGIAVNEVSPEIFPGDALEFRATVKNNGEIAVDRSRLEIPLPEGLTFSQAAPNLLLDENSNGAFSFEPARGPAGTIVWEMGQLPVTEDNQDVVGTFDYVVEVSENCSELMLICNGEVAIDGTLFGDNALTQTPLDPIPFITGYNQSETCFNQSIPGPLVFEVASNPFLEENCGWNSNGLEIPVCVSETNRVIVGSFAGFFPEGTDFYESPPNNPGEQGVVLGQSLAMDTDELTLYALPSPESDCYQAFTLYKNDLSLVPELTISTTCGPENENEIGVSVTGGMAPFSYLWNDPTKATTATLTGVAPGEYTVKVTDSLGCSDETTLIVPDPPVFALEVVESESTLDLGCDQDAVGMIVLAVEGENSPFVLDIVGESGTASTFSEQVVIPESGQHLIPDLADGVYQLTLADLNGCTVSQTVELTQVVNPDMQATFSFTSDSYTESGVLFQNSEIQFFAEVDSGEGHSFHWDFGNGQESTQQRPIVRYGESGTYLVRLDVADENGCQTSYEEYVEISGFFLRVPTAFRPNGNSPNDYFFPVFSEVKGLQFWVFNRWGELLFFTSDIHSKGWDGTHNGIEMPVGSYLYKLRYTDSQAVENQQAGSFSLVN